MKRKIMTLVLAVLSLFGLYFCFNNASAKETVESNEKGTSVYLQQQENDEHTKIRYIATIENLYDAEKLVGIDIHLTLSDGASLNKEADDTLDTIYTSVTDLKEEKDGTYYAIYTVTGIDKHSDCVMTAEMTLTFDDDSTIKSNKVSHNLTSTNTLSLDYVYNVLEGQSAAGNGQYLTKSLQEVYLSDDTFVDTGITATYNGATVTPTFDTSLFDATVNGECIVTANYNGESASFKVNKVSEELCVDGDMAMTRVDQNYTGVIGAQVDGYNMFTTIKQAYDFLCLNQEVPCNNRAIFINPGVYKEKLDFALPNMQILGMDEENTIIEYDSLYGTNDQIVYDNKGNRIAHTTDSTMTMAVRSSATNFYITGVTISNWWNSEEHFNSKTDYLTAQGLYSAGKATEHRALALLVQADQFVASDVKLLGYQDTLELMSGRQYITDSYISGATDFIFGTNNTTLFEGCTINSIYNGSTDGGYINAFKGQNKNAGDAIEYGVIYNTCEFTADSEVTSANTAIARPWGQTSAVMVMNSILGGHISKAAHTEGTTKNERYVTMSGCEPTLGTVAFYEYNNSGAGAITSSINGCTVLTDSVLAERYADYSVIYGKTNGNVVYNLAWNPYSGLEVDSNIYYNFNGTDEATGTNYTFNANTDASGNALADSKILTGSSLMLGNMIIDCTAGSAAYNKNSNKYNFKAGAKILIDVTECSSVTIKAHSADYAKFNIGGVGTITDTLVQYFATEQTVQIDITGDTYISQIIVNPSATAPEAATVSSLIVSGTPTADFQVGDAYDLSGITVKAVYSDNTYVTLTAADYTIDETNVDINTAGTYYATVEYAGATYDIKLVYVEDYDPRVLEACTWSFRDDTSKASDTYFVWDSTSNEFSKLQLSGAYSDNGNYIKFNTGATATFEVADACTVGVCYYAHISCEVFIDGVLVNTTDTWTNETTYINYVIPHAGVVTVVATSEFNGNSYLTFINVSNMVASVKKDTTLDFGEGRGEIASVAGVDISGASISPNNNNSMVNGTILINVKKDAMIAVASYKNYANYTIGEQGATGLETKTAPSYYVAEYDQTVEIICGANNYFYSIGIYYPTTKDVKWSFRTDTSNGNEFVDKVQNSSLAKDGLFIDAENGKFEPRSQQWGQTNNGTIIYVYVPAYATATICGFEAKYTVNDEAAVNGTTVLKPLVNTVYKIEITDDTYIDYIEILAPVVISENYSVTFQGSYAGTVNANSDSTIQLTVAETTYEGVTYVGCASNGSNNWLNFQQQYGAKISFLVAGPCTVNTSFYNGVNVGTVTINGVEVATETAAGDYNTKYAYEIPEAGLVEITANTNGGYLGFFEVVFE